jgi:hypothetical protein
VTPSQIAHVTNLANQSARGTGVTVKYEWDRKKQRFQWNYYRRGIYIGCTVKLEQVVEKMDRYITAT